MKYSKCFIFPPFLSSQTGQGPEHQGQERHQRRLRHDRPRQREVPDLGQGKGNRERRVVRTMRIVSQLKIVL